MMTTCTIHAAKPQFWKVIDRIEPGEKVIIARPSRPAR
jgi:antitoxin (DNA-binding transcriptional repressor) of toxin-antitoxin stability system